MSNAGPLSGIRVVEIAGLGPAPFCTMLLSDMGADVLRIDRIESAELGIVGLDAKHDLMNRGRRSVAMDLKKAEGMAIAKTLVAKADVLVEGFRPGVMERLGLGPEVCLDLNPRLVYGRMTGWGQDGPLSHAAGHDLNYIAVSGALHSIGRAGDTPVPPLNLVGDFGGGALYLAFGICCALIERQSSGKGQIVDAAIAEGAASLMTFAYGLRAIGLWNDERGTNILDSGAPWYDVYETKDGKYVSIAAIEARFYRNLLRLMDLDGPDLPAQHERSRWPELRLLFAERFKQKTRDEWCQILEGSDSCFAPVLSLEEAPTHPHNAARGTFIEIDGIVQPAPAPRFSRSQPHVQSPPPRPGEEADSVLMRWGFTDTEVDTLRRARTIL